MASLNNLQISLRCIFVFLLLSHGIFLRIFARLHEEEEEFSEELVLKPLPDHKVLAHFHFDTRVPSTRIYGPHHRLFPKAIYQLVQKFRIRELELSFTQGRWNYELWGGFDPMSSSNAKPPGVELWAIFDVPPDQVDATWRNMTHSLSGLFCASINFLESSTAYAAPSWSFRPNKTHGSEESSDRSLRYGALPREAVCTENLTPWLKLLPCRDKAGLAALMDRPSIYRGFYHSQRLYIISSEFGWEAKGAAVGTILQQTLTVVLQPDRLPRSAPNSGDQSLQPSWSISSLFGRKVNGRCVLAKTSSIFIELERNLGLHMENSGTEKVSLGAEGIVTEGSWNNSVFKLSPIPDRLINEVENSHNGATLQSSSILYKFSVEDGRYYEPLDVGISWKLPIIWSSPQPPFHVSRFLMGSGNARGSIAISLRSTQSRERLLGDMVRVVFFQVMPWYVKVYFHTLQVFINGQPQPMSDVVQKMHVTPSEDRVSPGMMEMVLTLPCSAQSAVLTMEFDKGFLHIDEYPPDANQGFDLTSAVISYLDFHASKYYLKEDSSIDSPFLFKLQEKNIVQSYTEVLLLPLATPDFSMPYNVITLTCTVLALYFGALLNVLRRRIDEEERFLKNKAAMKGGLLTQLISKLFAKQRGNLPDPTPSSSSLSPQPSSSPLPILSRKLFKIIFIAGAAVVANYYLKGHLS